MSVTIVPFGGIPILFLTKSETTFSLNLERVFSCPFGNLKNNQKIVKSLVFHN